MSAIEKDSYRLAKRLLDEAGVVVTPGGDYGPLAEGHVRVVFGHASEEDVKEGIKRIKKALM
jgi:aspartate/methionine/tyrosine aminotransferase